MRNLSQKIEQANIHDLGNCEYNAAENRQGTSGKIDQISQIQFIQLWKTFFDFMAMRDTEMHLYQALAVTGKSYIGKNTIR